MTPRVYLDHNASSPLRPQARGAMLAALDIGGNPSSVHAEGRAARALVAGARRQVAGLVGADPRGVVFTASATEAANLVLAPGLAAGRSAPPTMLLVGATEHACVLGGHRFAAAQRVPVDVNGEVDLPALRALVESASGPVMLALQLANNETGVVQPVGEAAAIIHGACGIVVCDAVQAAGRVPVDIVALGADALLLSSHKIGGPKGAGALVFADPDAHIAAPLLRGGGQERGFRAGTEDVPAISGFGAACEAVSASGAAEANAMLTLRERLEEAIASIHPALQLIGTRAIRLPNTTCFSVPGVAATTLLMALDLSGIAVSSGSACSSGKIGRSHVLDAMALDTHIASGAVRVSLGWTSTAQDVVTFVDALGRILGRLTPEQAA